MSGISLLVPFTTFVKFNCETAFEDDKYCILFVSLYVRIPYCRGHMNSMIDLILYYHFL